MFKDWPQRVLVSALGALTGAWLLVGCVAPPPAPELAAAPVEVALPEATAPPPAPVYGNFTSDTLFDLLVAELSLRRGDFAPAVDRYAQHARSTLDPGVVAKAARLASVIGDERRAVELGMLWARVAPDDPEARQAAAVALLEAGDYESALVELGALRTLGGEADFRRFAGALEDIAPDARAALIRALEALQRQWPDDSQLRLARATLLEQEGRTEEALAAFVDQPPELWGVDALLLNARLLERSGDTRAAVRLLEDALARGNSAPRIRYRLARLLIDGADLVAAREQFRALLEAIDDNAEVLLSLALIDLELDRRTEAKVWLERMLAARLRPDTANYFLGVIAEREGDVAAALASWQRVAPGFEFARAQEAATRLIVASDGAAAVRTHLAGLRQKWPQERVTLWLLEGQVLLDAAAPALAIEALSEGLQVSPDLPELLYARAMAHGADGRLDGLEADLSRILELDPEDAMALNALGYTLADHTERLDEARALVERALEVAPGEPAYVDSLGWVEYRAGNFEAAVALLEEAYAGFPNDEVAAHLGEALWMSGEEARARAVWFEALEYEQSSDVLHATLRRLLDAEELERLGVPADAAT